MFKILSTCKGGGYRYCRTEPPHPKRNAKGLYPLHRVVMENHLGRLLRSDEVVHHKNHDKTDDRIENLELMINSEHSRMHARRVLPVVLECPVCRKSFLRAARNVRFRARRGQVMTCSRQCGGRIGAERASLLQGSWAGF